MINAGNTYIGSESISTAWEFDNFGNVYVDGQFITRSATLRADSITCGTGILWYLAGHLTVESGANVCESLEIRPYGLGDDFRVKCSDLRNVFSSKGLGVDNGTRNTGLSPGFTSTINTIR